MEIKWSNLVFQFRKKRLDKRLLKQKEYLRHLCRCWLLAEMAAHTAKCLESIRLLSSAQVCLKSLQAFCLIEYIWLERIEQLCFDRLYAKKAYNRLVLVEYA